MNCNLGNKTSKTKNLTRQPEYGYAVGALAKSSAGIRPPIPQRRNQDALISRLFLCMPFLSYGRLGGPLRRAVSFVAVGLTRSVCLPEIRPSCWQPYQPNTKEGIPMPEHAPASGKPDYSHHFCANLANIRKQARLCLLPPRERAPLGVYLPLMSSDLANAAELILKGADERLYQVLDGVWVLALVIEYLEQEVGKGGMDSYSLLPTRSAKDNRLDEDAYRVLIAINTHKGMCSIEEISRMIELEIHNVEHALSDLKEFGYCSEMIQEMEK